MKVLVNCEESQAVCIEFRKRGHEAYSCDLKECSGGRPEWHIQADARSVLHDGWDLMIAHPPCTRLCNSGVCWLEKRNLWKELEQAAELFVALLGAPVKRKAIENPIPHKYALKLIGRRYDQIIQPYEFGHPERKATCLWLEGLPELIPTKIVELPEDKSKAQRLHYLPPSPERATLRSKTYAGIARAMAEQWDGACLAAHDANTVQLFELNLR